MHSKLHNKKKTTKDRGALNNAMAKAFFSDFCMFAVFDAGINLRIVFKKDFDSDLLLSKAATVKNNLKQLHKGCFNWLISEGHTICLDYNIGATCRISKVVRS